MKASTSAALFLLAFAGTCCIPSRVPTHQQMAAALATETVELVQLPDPDAKCAEGDIDCLLKALMGGGILEEPHVYCSGVWVSPTEILTANHCVEDEAVGATLNYATQGDVTTLQDGKIIYDTHLGKLKLRDAAHDLALIDTSPAGRPAHGVARVAATEPLPGDVALAMGSPLGQGWTFSVGDVSQIRYVDSSEDGKPDVYWYVQATTPIAPGSSGCGLFNERGELIGIARMTMPRAQNLNYFTHRDHIEAFLTTSRAPHALTYGK